MRKLSNEENLDVDFWGEVLKQWPEEVVNKLGISSEDKRYLIDVGFPVGIDWNTHLSIDIPEDVSALQFSGKCPILAHIDAEPIVIDSRDGTVWLGGAATQRVLVNTRVRFFGHFLRFYQECRVRGMKIPKNRRVIDSASLIEKAYKAMKNVDPRALQSEETYWSMVMWETRQGLG